MFSEADHYNRMNLFCNNDWPAAHYSVYYAATYPINKYMHMKY